MTRYVFTLLAALVLFSLPVIGSAAPLVAKIDISSQTMTVYENG